ncbi:MAG: SDR family oxidoreductase [Microscillaceae bacterium]|nr:SDR family oxidoreductase [Microscillaceae bacterium]MDW8461525.1 SDR family oxidoreductase [Cytophagales bacterium]
MSFFENKVILVTGGSSGIGQALCRTLAMQKAIVYNADLQAPSQPLPKVNHIFLDVRSYEQFQQVIQQIYHTHNRIDILINNAGIGIAGEAQDLSIAEWQKVIDVNLHGVINGSKLAYDLMVQQGFGHIVNMASMAALIPFPLAVPYATAKHAVLGLSKSLRIEGLALGVRVTAICPGFVESALYDNAIKAQTTTEKIKSTIPFPILPTEKAVKYILRGIVKNKAVVTFPLYTRLTAWLEKLFPTMVNTFILQKTVTAFRKKKINKI